MDTNRRKTALSAKAVTSLITPMWVLHGATVLKREKWVLPVFFGLS